MTLLYESEDHYSILNELLDSVPNPHGNLFHDCHIAALLKENGVSLIYTRDRDFRNFPFLDIKDPL